MMILINEVYVMTALTIVLWIGWIFVLDLCFFCFFRLVHKILVKIRDRIRKKRKKEKEVECDD